MSNIKNHFETLFYSLAVIGLMDMMVQAWTSGKTKPIHIVLGFLFGAS